MDRNLEMYRSRWVDFRDWYHLCRFPNWRKDPSLRDALKMAANGWHRRGLKSRRSQFGIPSGPGANLLVPELTGVQISSVMNLEQFRSGL